MKIGFMVWSPEGGMPTRVHASYEDAAKEVRRLSSRLPSQTFFVMAPITAGPAEDACLAYDLGRRDGISEGETRVRKEYRFDADHFRARAEHAERKLRRSAPLLSRAEPFRGIVADCLLWFDGFRAAHAGREHVVRAPDRETLRELNAALQSLDATSRGSDEDEFDEVPF